MKIRNLWQKFVLFAAAVFWASCSDDDSSKSVIAGPDPEDTSSSSEDSGLQNQDPVSSSNFQASSSSFAESSSSSRDDLVMSRPMYGVYMSSAALEPTSSSSVAASSNSMEESSSSTKADVGKYCEDHGGVKGYDTECGENLIISEYECEDIAKEKAFSKIYPQVRNVDYDSIPEEQKNCIRKVMYDLMVSMPEYGVYNGCLYEPEPVLVQCEDGKAFATDKKKQYSQRYDECEQKSSTLIEQAEKQIEDCKNS